MSHVTHTNWLLDRENSQKAVVSFSCTFSAPCSCDQLLKWLSFTCSLIWVSTIQKMGLSSLGKLLKNLQYKHTYIHTYMQTHTQMHTHIHTQTCTQTYIHTYTHNTHTYLYTHNTHTCIFVIKSYKGTSWMLLEIKMRMCSKLHKCGSILNVASLHVFQIFGC